jgi:NitT/TauT family transport system ATP-binding protein
MGALISCTDLEVWYSTSSGDIHALGPVSLDIEQGEFISIVGPSGCGKSTLLRVLAGLMRPTSGTVEGVDQGRTGVVFQQPVLLDWRDVLGNVLLQADVRKADRNQYQDRALALLDQVGLGDFSKKRPYELSGGMQQRVAICRALLHEPQLVLMDEPFGALDALTREQMAEDLYQLWRDSGRTVFFVTHSIAEAVLLSTRVLVLSARPGRIVADIPVDIPGRSFRELDGQPAFAGYSAQVREHLERTA